MKYPASTYARAFALAAESGKKADSAQLVKNLLAIVHRNGDAKELGKIAAGADKILREKEGRKKFVIESARPLSEKLRRSLSSIADKRDIIEEKVVPSLVAGVRIVVDDERQFDASLARKLQKMFG